MAGLCAWTYNSQQQLQVLGRCWEHIFPRSFFAAVPAVTRAANRSPAGPPMIQVGISKSLGLTFEDAAQALTHCSSLWMPCAPQETIRKVFPLNLGGSDTCYFCKKRVYVMERLSAEGHFFHRECFRCSVCATTLRLAAYAFDGDEGKFFCKPHFIHCKTNTQQRKRRAELKQQREEEGMWKEQEGPRRDPPTESSCAAAAIGSPAGSPPESKFSRL
ncbi:microtubule associated monooxygenase, calponin and LIM domain containing 2 [Rhinolophus ferrumequinum]|uniref:Microtubule associated monooxygenase, calponin and LIM domain containing 2 n=1 Tax=Rhinolophus ferrumequinum TaxID=59479 RepID=A0A7J7W821_RHIFE|nr:microtubule associated monooxygenase, calponin and LIM domain containing 2 [Rhinolophus ferrumequinum]